MILLIGWLFIDRLLDYTIKRVAKRIAEKGYFKLDGKTYKVCEDFKGK